MCFQWFDSQWVLLVLGISAHSTWGELVDHFKLGWLLTRTVPTAKKILLQSAPIQGNMRQDSMMSRYKPSYTHGSTVYPSPILSGLHLRDRWLGCEGSLVQNGDKTAWLLLTLLSSFIHPSLPSCIRRPSALGLTCLVIVLFCLFLFYFCLFFCFCLFVCLNSLNYTSCSLNLMAG